jgi:hypothetical protein
MDIDRALTAPSFVDHEPRPLWQQMWCDDPIHWTEGLRLLRHCARSPQWGFGQWCRPE